MRIAALYDVHGNLPALEAVLEEVEHARVEAVVSGGDVVWGPRPAECLRLLREADAVFVRGNCEREVAERRDEAAAWCAERLAEEELAFVRHLPLVVELGNVRFCHATPRDDGEIVTRLSSADRVRAAFTELGEGLVVCGHTHQQYDRSVDGVRVVNAGSVGLPYEGTPEACWALLDGGVQLRRTAYDHERAAVDAEASGFPGAAVVVAALREPPDPDEVAADFEARAGA